MKINRHILSLLLALLASAAPAQSAAPPRQQTQEGHQCLVFFLGGMAGPARGQTLRYTWANLGEADPRESVFEPLHIRVTLFAADGSVLAQQEAAAVGAGRSQSFDFDRDAMPPAGEPGTGRLQVQVRVEVILAARQQLSPDAPDLFLSTLELVDNAADRTMRFFAVVDRTNLQVWPTR
jgi:hypothetical protein